MKRIFNNIIKSFSILILAVSISACSSQFANNNQKENNWNVTVSGKIISGVQSAGRSAVTSFSLPSGYTYSVSACFGTASGNPVVYTWDTTSPVNGTVNASTLAYTLELPKPGHWKLILSLVDSSDVASEVLAQEVDITASDTTLTQNLEIKQTFTFGTSSNISLQISKTSASSDIQFVKWHWLDSGITLDDSQKKFDEGVTGNGLTTVTFNYSDVPVGTYNVQFIFTKTNGDEYSFNDVINVSSIFTTDTWYGNSIYLTKDDITNNYSFVVSDELLASQSKYREFKTTATNTPYVLYSKIAAECEEAQWDDNAGVWVEKYSSSYGNAGAKVFSSLSGNETITKPAFNSTNFCFCDDGVFAVEEASGQFWLNKYGEAYAGYTKSGTGINLSTECPGIEELSSITCSDNIVYFFWKKNEGGPDIIMFSAFYDFPSGSNCTIECAQLVSLPLKLALTEENILFYTKADTVNPDKQSLNRALLAINTASDMLSVDFTNEISYTLDASSFDFYCYGDLRFGDLFVQKDSSDIDYVYALVYSFAHCNSMYEYYDYGGGDEGYEPVYSNFSVSNGGVLRFNVPATYDNLTPTGWTTGDTLLGWYTRSGDQDYYDSETGSKKTIEDGRAYTVQPPLNSEQYLFGARKFIAKKPGVIVFTDDGGCFTDDGANDAIKPVNRVVTLDPDNATFSMTNVNVTFETSFKYVNNGFVLEE